MLKLQPSLLAAPSDTVRSHGFVTLIIHVSGAIPDINILLVLISTRICWASYGFQD